MLPTRVKGIHSLPLLGRGFKQHIYIYAKTLIHFTALGQQLKKYWKDSNICRDSSKRKKKKYSSWKPSKSQSSNSVLTSSGIICNIRLLPSGKLSESIQGAKNMVSTRPRQVILSVGQAWVRPFGQVNSTFRTYFFCTFFWTSMIHLNRSALENPPPPSPASPTWLSTSCHTTHLLQTSVDSDGMERFLLDLCKSHYDKLSKARNNRDRAIWWESNAIILQHLSQQDMLRYECVSEWVSVCTCCK